MEATVLDTIALAPDLHQLLSRLRIASDSGHAAEVEGLLREAQAAGRPRALYGVAFIESRSEDAVTVDGVTFTSRVLRVNLDQAHRIFPFVATCGMELEMWSRSIRDPLYRYWSDTIREMALRQAFRALDEDLEARYGPGRTAAMSPGSLADWPLREQRPLFELLGDPQGTIGVQLTEDYLMIPTKSGSGLRFPTKDSFESCQLCPRLGCPGRRAPYDEGLYARRYRPPG